jgi:hypothetical protein
VATAEDYEAAYKLFKANSSRSAVNVGDTHRKILDAVYELTNENPFEDSAFGVRKIAEKAGISPGTVTKNRAFLTKSLGFLWEPEDEKGLALVPGVGPEDWAGGNALEGFPLPFEVRKWQEGTPPSPEPGNSGNTETRRGKSAYLCGKRCFHPRKQQGNTGNCFRRERG